MLEDKAVFQVRDEWGVYYTLLYTDGDNVLTSMLFPQFVKDVRDGNIDINSFDLVELLNEIQAL